MIPGDTPVFRYNPGNSGMVGRYVIAHGHKRVKAEWQPFLSVPYDTYSSTSLCPLLVDFTPFLHSVSGHTDGSIQLLDWTGVLDRWTGLSDT